MKNKEKKWHEINPFHYPDVLPPIYERKISSTIGQDGQIWGAIGAELNGIRKILLFNENNKTRDQPIELLRPVNTSCNPVISKGQSKNISLVWVEFSTNQWQILYQEIDADGAGGVVETIRQGESLCFQPSIVYHNGTIIAAWSEYDKTAGRFCICCCQKEAGEQWTNVKNMSQKCGDSFRPYLASNGDQVILAWDYVNGDKYDVAYRIIYQPEENDTIKRLSTPGERWMNPKIVAQADGTFYLSWQIISDVADHNLGIVDHLVQIAGVKIELDKAGLIERTVDLKEGLLGSKIYVSYASLRRMHYLAAAPNGDLWLLWEMRFEDPKDNVAAVQCCGFSLGLKYGYLLGKRLRDGQWGETKFIHEGGSNYALAGRVQDNKLSLSYKEQYISGKYPVFKTAQIDLESLSDIDLNADKWSRWQPYEPVKRKAERQEIIVDGEKLYLFWADTHVHSNYSPDAEGEPDESILFAREIAGIDAMAMVDNDYYPHAGLMETEWLIQQELAEIYTKEGQFVVFPGYEFTYHNPETKPDNNHRYVIYPRKGGELWRRVDPETHNMPDLIKKLRGSSAQLFAHHPTWELTGESFDSNVEVCSSWRVCIEEKDFVIKRLLQGDKFGFIGSSDTHRVCPGLGGALTGVYARDLTPESLFEGYIKHRTVATQGKRIGIDLRVNNLFLGDTGTIEDDVILKLKVDAPEELEFVEIYRNDEVIRRFDVENKQFSAELIDDDLSEGDHFYFVRVKTKGDASLNEPDSVKDVYDRPFSKDKTAKYPHNFARADGPFAWSTPVWVTKTDVKKVHISV